MAYCSRCEREHEPITVEVFLFGPAKDDYDDAEWRWELHLNGAFRTGGTAYGIDYAKAAAEEVVDGLKSYGCENQRFRPTQYRTGRGLE